MLLTTQDERQRGRDTRSQYTEPNSIISQHELRGDIPEGNSLTNTEKIHPRIINLSHRKLQLREINLLKRGLKFTPTPNEDKTQLGADIDEFGRRLRINYIFCEDNEENEEEENKPLVRNKSDWIPKPTKDKDLEETIKTLKTNSLTSNKNVKDNLTREEKTALQNLKSDKSIIIKEADKGNAVVIMDREYYRDNILNMLQDEMSYEVTDKKLDRQTSTMIKKLLKKHKTELFEEEIDYISNSKFSESYFYGLPKIHKSKEISNAISEQNSEYIELLTPNDLKFRPIVGGPSSVTQNLSHFIDIVLKPLCREVPSFIRDDLDFLNHLPKTVNPNSELITFDIVSLYTNIPHDLGITAVKYWLENTENVIENRLTKEFILASLKLILERNIFYFNGTYYHQKKGTAMGRPDANVKVEIKITLRDYTKDISLAHMGIDLLIVHLQVKNNNYAKLMLKLSNLKLRKIRQETKVQRKGARIRECREWLESSIETLIQEEGNIWVYVWAGTCDFTIKNGRYISLRTHDDSVVDDIIAETNLITLNALK
ncbi:unnamed protein product [Mytilus edulis]|uniref:Reverse transcriptase domain-containing protein n=1 Tax=Mytilus edulis TaxID=6550 RepID=A0A8S3QRJ6_MYTED|nr:unnamed protein product [Mytilus edulis]